MGEAIEPVLKVAADPSRQMETQEYSCCATDAAKYLSIHSSNKFILISLSEKFPVLRCPEIRNYPFFGLGPLVW